MDLLDRYVHAVRFWLPRGQQDDITAELAEDLRSQIEEQEAKLGRKLTELEVASLLKGRGRPVFVAGRYRPQQYLIGPTLFPIYRFVLFIVALCYLLPWMLVWVSLEIFDPFYHSHVLTAMGQAWGSFWITTIVAVGIVTIVFAIIERIDYEKKFMENWDPRKLPPVRDPNRIPRFNSVFELAANGVFAVWWLNWMSSLTLLDRGGVRIVLAPAWHPYYWAMLAVALANIALAAVNLAHRYWTWRRGILRLILEIAGAIPICWLFKANILAQIVLPNLSAARATGLVNSINLNMARSFPYAVACCAIVIVLSNTFRLIRLRTKRTGIMQGAAV